MLIGGPSGTGKTIAAKQLALRYDASWLQADDLRLALQRSRVTLPRDTEALYFFEETPNVWQLPPKRLCDALIAVGQVMSPSLEVIIENHVDTVAPVVIEGDSILPSLFARASVRDRASSGHIHAVFLVEPEEDTMLANMIARDRGITGQTALELRTEARAKWLYGQWLASEAYRHNLPILEPHPWSTLVERVIIATSSA